MDEGLSVVTVVAGLGFLAGILFGFTAQRTNFCTMGAISDMVLMEDYGRFRSWVLAIAVALLGTQLLTLFGVINIDSAMWLSPNFGWAGYIIGGLIFGYGMTRAGGCGNKTLVRLGAGNLKSVVVVLFIALSGYMTLRGLFALARVELESLTSINTADVFGISHQGFVHLISGLTGAGDDIIRWILAIGLGVALLIYCFKDAEFRGSPRNIIAGVVIGLLIPVGWYITSVLGFDEFEMMEAPAPMSFTFIAPTAETAQYLMTFTGTTINFGIATVFGVIFGSFIGAILNKEFNMEAFHGSQDMLSHIWGGILMGFGGVLALGCTIGQGITGVATLSFGSFIAFVSIVIGGIFGMKTLEEGSFVGGLKGMFSRS